MNNSEPKKSPPSSLRSFLPAALSVGLAAVLLVILIPRELNSLYVDDVAKRRKDIDSFMRFSTESPILEAEKPSFSGLDYFPIDKQYRVKATLELIDDSTAFALPTTGNTEDLFERYAWAKFDLMGASYRLLLLRSDNTSASNNLFLAFNDETNREDTYAGGRYVDLYFDNTASVIIDFNRAYNPYCVYNPTYVCPIPPDENRLSVRIEAGERIYPLETPAR